MEPEELLYGVVSLGERIALSAIVGLALIIGGAEITLRGAGANRTEGKAKLHEYRARHPSTRGAALSTYRSG